MNIEAIVPKDLAEAKDLALLFSRSTFVPKDLKGKPEDCLIVILNSLELGFYPAQGLRMFAIFGGKVSLTADGIAALVMKRRDVCEYLTVTALTDESCTYEAKRSGSDKVVTYTYTMADAKKAGLINHMYQKYPRPMLRARCISAICKAAFPDLAAGLYEDDTGEITGNQPSPNYGKEVPRVDVMGPPVAADAREPGSDDGDTAASKAVRADEYSAGTFDGMPAHIDAHEPSELDKLIIRINECQSLEALKKLVPAISKFTSAIPPEDKKLVQAAYGTVQTALKRAAAS